MLNWAKIRIKIRDFYQKYKKIIFIIIIIWAVIIAINTFLKNRKIEIKPITTYEPHTSVMDTTSSVPTQLQQPISNAIDKFINYCNNKEYENAYNLLTKSCKEYKFQTLEKFKEYVDDTFPNKKVYNIQNYSNVGSTYIYNVRIMDDMLATGLNEGEYYFYEEKFAVIEENNEIKLSINDYIEEKEKDIIVEDEYMKLVISNKISEYDIEKYKVKITNRTDKYIVLMDGTESSEILLAIGNKRRRCIDQYNANIVLLPGETKETTLRFEKFYDDGVDSTALIFNAVRILKEYSGDKNKSEEEKENAVKLYSMTVSLQ